MEKQKVPDETKHAKDLRIQPDKETGPCCAWEFSCHCEDKEKKVNREESL